MRQGGLGRCPRTGRGAGRALGLRPRRIDQPKRARLEPCSHWPITSGLPTVADRPMRWMSRPHIDTEALEQRREVGAAVVGGEGVDLVDDHRRQAREERPRVGALALIIMTSSDSGVVIKMCAGASRKPCLRESLTSPCHLKTSRPTMRA
jgi:hypothetical protein